jgi:tetratricopeptide (TPR) repeat protein
VPRAELEERIRDWQRLGTLPFATDLAASAIVLGEEDAARDAAVSILAASSGASELARELARRLLEEDTVPQRISPEPEEPKVAAERVRALRQRLRGDPRNAIRWSELARQYSILGISGHAKRAMDAAVALAPNDRFVLRSAAGLSVHLDEPDRGHVLLASAEATPYDPWLIAAEVAVASRAGRSPRFAKQGRLFIQQEAFDEFQLSELASALATIELGAASTRRAKRLFLTALEDPTENSVAQAVWASRRLELPIAESALDAPDSFEARARLAAREGDWRRAADEAWFWLYDQSFAAEPAIFGSYEASLGRAYDEGVRFASEGLVANPSDVTLRNNLAFCLIHQGELKRARRELRRVRRDGMKPRERALILATWGLLRFREGQPEHGRKLYARAIEEARDPSQRALAAILLAREELLARGTAGTSAVQEALRLFEVATSAGGDVTPTELELWLNELREILDGSVSRS